MKEWNTTKCQVTQTTNAQGLLVLDVYNLQGEYIGTIEPKNAEMLLDMIDDLNFGSCPIADKWFLDFDSHVLYLTPDGWKLQREVLNYA